MAAVRPPTPAPTTIAEPLMVSDHARSRPGVGQESSTARMCTLPTTQSLYVQPSLSTSHTRAGGAGTRWVTTAMTCEYPLVVGRNAMVSDAARRVPALAP